MKLVKRFMAVSLCAAMSVSLAACGSSASSDKTTAAGSDTAATTAAGSASSDGSYENCELTFSWWGGDSRHTATIAAVEAFEAKYPGITVSYNYGAWSDWETAMATQFSSGSALM